MTGVGKSSFQTFGTTKRKGKFCHERIREKKKYTKRKKKIDSLVHLMVPLTDVSKSGLFQFATHDNQRN